VTQNSSENLDDAVRDDAYFALFGQLISQNSSRYEEQARSLLKEKSLVLRIDNLWVEYSLDRNGCRCNISYDSGNTFSKYAWTRLGWTRKKKEKKLPSFFAQTEADVKFGLEN
jgi:hypothetical protein